MSEVSRDRWAPGGGTHPNGPFQHDPLQWVLADRTIALDRPTVMGIVNLTPDSFSDGGELGTVDAALRRADQMVRDGAAILDVGGESTRPGATPVSDDEELRRVLPVLEALISRLAVPVSVDTRKARVARSALDLGAVIVNDVSGLSFDPDMASVVAHSRAGLVLMHMRGTPGDMAGHAVYRALENEVAEELQDAISRALDSGIRRDALVIDPGIGFAKTSKQSLRMLGTVDRLGALGLPVMVGPSRKSFLGEVLDLPPEERAVGSAAACVMAYLRGAHIFRVHDVAATVQALAVAEAVLAESQPCR